MKNLVIVESPAKAKTIEKFLGKDYTVKSSFGHIRDLSKKKYGINIENNFEPDYEISSDKVKVVAELKKEVAKAQTVYLASDEDREGEAIAWHLAEVLKLDKKNTKRIVFHEITKKAIETAIQTPRDIDQNLVNAQQARRVLDRLVGFELSPLLWKKIRPSLSAGRVQSVAVRLLVEREREINAFNSQSSFKVSGYFAFEKNSRQYYIDTELNKKLDENEVLKFLKLSTLHKFQVSDVQTKPGKKSPAAPFTTSTLQQEASRKFGFSVLQTMVIAQRLYENGHITYMRTDSTSLSEEATDGAKKQIAKLYGEEYSQTRHFTTKIKGAQEAHEAIRPTYFENSTIKGAATDQKLYELIWKRAVASQMSDAILEKTTIVVPTPIDDYKFIASCEIIKFDGFLKLYIETADEDDDSENQKLLPPIQTGQQLDNQRMEAVERFTLHSPRYSEASLVKKMEELGIGRPSTYAPTISTIQQRQYVVKEDRPAQTRIVKIIELQGTNIKSTKKKENYGAEKAKLFPTDIGTVVNDYLVEKFNNIMNYSFTAEIEKEFDDIADGTVVWNNMIANFYNPFHQDVIGAEKVKEKRLGERILGTDPASGHTVLVRIGRFGPLVQIGTTEEIEQPVYAPLRSGQSMETITFAEALSLFDQPKDYGIFEDEPITFGSGRFGPYLKHKKLYYSIPNGVNKDEIDHEKAVQIILDKREQQSKKTIKTFDENPDLKILNGRYGPYISYQKNNFKIPKDKEAKELTLIESLEIINNAVEKGTSKKQRTTTVKKEVKTKKTTKTAKEKVK